MEKDDYNAAMNAWIGDCDAINPCGTNSFDIAYSETWGPPYDATSKLFDMTYEWGSGEADAVATSNLATMPKAQFVSNVRALSTTTDLTARQALYTNVLTTLHDEAIFVPLSAKHQIAVVNNRVSNFRFGCCEFDIPVAKMAPMPIETPYAAEVSFSASNYVAAERFTILDTLAEAAGLEPPVAGATLEVTGGTVAASFPVATAAAVTAAQDAVAGANLQSLLTAAGAAMTVGSAATVTQVTPPPPPSPPSPPPPSSSSSDDDSDSTLSSGAIAGITVAGVVLGGLLVFSCFLVRQEQRGTPIFTPLKAHVVEKATKFESRSV